MFNSTYNYIIQHIDNKYTDTILVVLVIILIAIGIYDIIKTFKANKKISTVVTRIKDTVTQDKAAIAAANAPAVAGVSITTEQSIGSDIWRIYAIKIAFDDTGVIDDKKLTAMFDNHWEPIQYCNENGHLLMRQRITKVTQIIGGNSGT